MGKVTPPRDKADELRQVTREANAILGDLRRTAREIEKLVDSGFEKHVAASAKRADDTILSMMKRLAEVIKDNSDACLEAILNRWAYIETACVADDSVGRLIAMHILKNAGGTVQTETATWHLVRETTEPDGTYTFAFPGAMVSDADHDPQVDAAIRTAVETHRPGIKLRPWTSRKTKGIDEL